VLFRADLMSSGLWSDLINLGGRGYLLGVGTPKARVPNRYHP